MKRIIYTLTAIFSAAAAVLLIIDYIMYINESGEFYFDPYPDPFIAVMLALCVLSAVQLKKHTPRLTLVLCGYIFIALSAFRYSWSGYNYLTSLLLMAAALTPAIYEFSHYGMIVRQEPKANGQGRWRWLVAAATAVAAIRSLPFILQAIIDINVNNNNIFESYSTDIMGIAALICFAVFCGLMSRRTSALYRAFFTGCIIFDAVQTVFPKYQFFLRLSPPEPARTMFVFLAILYSLFILAILMHAFLTRRDGRLTEEHADAIQRAGTPAV